MRDDIVVEEGVRIPMRDGVALVADVYRPRPDESRSAATPTILIRTCFDRKQVERYIVPKSVAADGYSVVIQDVRGRYDSEGVFYHGVAERDDGYDTLEWIAAQSWSTGRIGMTGVSYLAAVQSAAACSGSPHLSSLFHVKGPSNYFHHCNRHGGAFHMFQLPVTFYFAAHGKEATEDPELKSRLLEAWHASEEWLQRLPLREGETPLKDTPHIERWLLDMMTKSDYSDFWKSEPLWQVGEHVEAFADIPAIFIGSWFDVCRADTYFPLLAAKSANRKLMMGPWVHIDFEQVSGDVDFGESAALARTEYMTLQKRWFDATLKGDDDGFLAEPPVRIFVMGGGSGRRTDAGHLDHGGYWRDETTWPPADASYERLYLAPGGELTWDLPRADGGASSYRYDPDDPVPTTGGTAFFFRDREKDWFDLFVPLGAHDHRAVQGSNVFGTDGRDDVLTFQTAPLAEAVEVTGPLGAEVWLSATTVDTDLTVKLLDVYPPNDDYPDGYAMNLADGLLRLRYRDSFERPTLLTPGTIYRVEVPSDIFGVTSNQFAAGHRIRIDISSSNFPAFDRNPNNGTLMTHEESQPVVTEVSIHHSGDYPSHVMLPIIRRADVGR